MIPTKYRANILSIPNSHQRYRTIADWFHEDDNLQIRVSTTRKDYEFLSAIKQQIEQYLCEKAGIKESTIDAWRLTHEGDDEPGTAIACPFREQHLFAEAVEKVLADKIGVDWKEYGMALDTAMDEKTIDLKPVKKSHKPSRLALTLQTQRILQEQEG